MKVKENTIRGFFSGKNLYEVPSYQRRYAWKTANFTQLWEDLQAIANGDAKHHYMGTIVFKPKRNKLLIVDGQQRLATFTIFMKAMIDVSVSKGYDDDLGLNGILYSKDRHRFTPSFADKAAFISLHNSPEILRKNSNEKQIRECYWFFRESIENDIVNSGNIQSRKARFMKIASVALDLFRFVEISLSNDDDENSIFETINYAGVSLTSADLARNFVLSRGKNEDMQDLFYKKYWVPLENDLSLAMSLGELTSKKKSQSELNKILPDYLRSVLIVETQKPVSSSDVFKSFKTFFRGKDPEESVKTICKYKKYYCRFINPELEPRAGIKSYLMKFKDQKMTTHYPVLLVLYMALDKKKITAKEFELCMKYIESFVVRRAFNSKVSRDFGQVFSGIASKLNSKRQTRRKISDVFVELLSEKKWPNDSDFSTCFVSSPIYTTAPEIAKYVLVSIEKSQPSSKHLQFENKIQIEHVFPQGAKDSDWNKYDMPELKKRLNCIGNLTLAAGSYNASYGNRPFIEKKNGKDGYKKTKYWITEQSIANRDQWTKTEVDLRSKKLLKKALDLWPGPN